MVGAAVVQLPRWENLHTCWFDPYVRPACRRQGTGTSLLGDVEARAAQGGRTTLQEAAYVLPGDTGPGERFAVARGYGVEMQKVLSG